eukprot:3925527-Amphidinium_carterae.4
MCSICILCLCFEFGCIHLEKNLCNPLTSIAMWPKVEGCSAAASPLSIIAGHVRAWSPEVNICNGRRDANPT